MAEFEYNGFKYKSKSTPVNQGDFDMDIIHGQEIPEYLYKYYAFNKNSIDALVNNYFFASHPYQLNDAMDSSMFLLAAKNLTLDHYKRFLGETLELKEIKQIFEDDKLNNYHFYILHYWTVTSNLFGIISLAAEGYSPLMWPHYTNEKGFQIKLNSNKLYNSLKEKIEESDGEIVSFSPVNYCEKLTPIDISEYDFMNVPFLYSTNVKSDKWDYESEWRFVVSRGQMGVPNSARGLNLEKDYLTDVNNRKLFYDKEVIEEIVIGHDFLNSKDFHLKIKIEPREYIVRPKNRKDGTGFTKSALSFLNYLHKNLKANIYLSGTKYESNDNNESIYLVRTKERMEIEKINAQTFKFTRTGDYSVLG